MKKTGFLLICLMTATSVFAGSIRLVNNSNDRLRAIVTGSDGSNLGEFMIDPQESKRWKDTDRYQANRPLQEGDLSKEPYTVSWYCVSGNLFSECSNVTTGSLIMSSACHGQKRCRANQQRGYPLHQEEEIEEE